jgi:hypothetical protein
MSVSLSIYLFTYISVIYIENTRTPMTTVSACFGRIDTFSPSRGFQELQILVDIPDSFGRPAAKRQSRLPEC